MTIFGGEQQLCPCYEECQQFHKIAELKDSGLVIYCHQATRTEEITRDEAVKSTSKDVFILHNKKDVKITGSELRSELEKKNISCPRCRKKLEHAQELMKEVKSIEKEIVMGICDHCRKQAQIIKKQFCICDDIVKKFKTVKGEQTEDIKKNVKIWLSKMSHLLKDSKAVHKQKQIKYRAHSDLQISRDHSPRQEPKIKQMFYPGDHESDLNLTKQAIETDRKENYLKPSVAFSQTSVIPRTSLLDTEKNSMKSCTDIKKLPRTSLKDEKQGEETFVDTPSMDAKQELKRRHDLSLRQMMRIERDPGVSISKRPHVDEIPKIAPWEQKEATSKYNVESETDIKITTKSKYDLSSKRLVKYGTLRTIQKQIRDSFYEQRKADKYYKSDRKRFSKPEEKNIKKQFSFFFPKVLKKEENQQIDVSSTHLIKYTQEKVHRQAEKKRQKEEYVQELEHDHKKISLEGGKVQAEEKNRQLLEDQKTYEEEQNTVTKHKQYSNKDLIKNDKTIRDQSVQDTFEKEGDSNKSEVTQKVRKLESKHRNKSINDFDKVNKGTKSKPEQEDKIDEVLKKPKKVLKSTLEERDSFDELLKKSKEDLKIKKDVKRKSELKDKGDEEEKISRKKDLDEKRKQKSKDTGVEKEIKEEGERDAKIRREKDALQKQAPNEIEKLLSSSKKIKKDIKGKSELKDAGEDEAIKSRKKDLTEKSKQKSKDRGMEKELQEGEQDLKLRRKKDALQKQAPNEIEKLLSSSKMIKKDIKGKSELKDPGDDEAIKSRKKDLTEKSKQKSKDRGMENELKEGERDVKLQTEKDALQKQAPNEIEKLLSSSKKIKKDVKGKSELKGTGDDEAIQSRIKDLKERSKQKSTDRSVEREIKEGERDAKLRREQDTLQKHAPNDIQKQISSSKNRKPTEQDSPDDIKVTQSTILKKIDREKKEKSIPEKNIIDIKQEKVIKIKTEEQEREEKLRKKEEEERLKLIAQMRKEKEAFKKMSEKEQQSKLKEVPSKKIKPMKINQDSPDDIKQTISEIIKKNSKTKKEMTVKEKDLVEIKIEKTGKVQEEKKYITTKDESDFKKLQAEHLKEKVLQKKKQMEHEAQIAREKERNKNDGEQNAQKDLKMGDIKVVDVAQSEVILRLVRIKQAASMKPSDIAPSVISEHRRHHEANIRIFCPLCYNSDLELEVISLDNKLNKPSESLKDIIIGEKIFKIKGFRDKSKEPGAALNLYQHSSFDTLKEITPLEEPVQKSKHLSENNIDMEPGKGVLRYALSDRTFIEKGWTVLPTEKVVRKMNVYRMRPAHPEFDWFEHNKNKRLMTYDTGERLAEFDDNGRGRWYYRNGRLALDYYDAEETNAQQRFVIYSSGEPDERGRTHPITILATFDYLGNGIVFDHAGKIRLKYNQTEGVVLDRSIGPVSHWKWHTLNDPPVLQQVMIDTQLPHKDPDILKLEAPPVKKTRPDNEEMLAIEFDNFIKEKSKKLSQKFKPFQIKMKALKINEHFSLRVLDQATVYLIYRDGSTNLKLNIGMILDHKEIVDTETAEVGEVSNSLEQFPARTDSLAGLQRSVAHAQRYERQHAERERRLRRPEPSASADQLTAAASPPLRLPFRTVPSGTSSTTGYCGCSRKPTNNLYYNTRLL